MPGNSLPSPGETDTGAVFASQIRGAFEAVIGTLKSTLDDIKKGWDFLIDRINEGIRKIEENFGFLGELWAWITDEIDDLVKKISNILRKVKEGVDKIFEKVEKAIDGSVPIISLITTALDWNTHVNIPLSEIAPDLSPSGAIDNWRGPAHETYLSRVQDQSDAVAAVVGKVKSTSDWLADVARMNMGYVQKLTEFGAALVGKLTSTGTAVAETPADPAAIVSISSELAETVGKIAEDVLALLVLLAERLVEVTTEINKLAGEYSDHIGLPGGRWPQAVSGS
jgi:methyl-accepting chemotaxis protein